MKTAVIIAASALLLSGVADSAEIKVLSTQATQEAYLELVAQFEKATGHTVATGFTGPLNVQKRLAGGETEIGFQQISELVHFPGIDYVGPLPGELQRMTMFSAGIHAGAKQADAARALLKFITAPAAAAVIRKHGLEPA